MSETRRTPWGSDPPPRLAEEHVTKIGDLAAEAGIERVHVLAWRDLADVEAGGSEVHIDHVARHWAAAGVEVTLRTSFAPGHSPFGSRHGYVVVRRAGRYLVFPRSILNEATGRHGPRDALVEVWNGVPFLSPIWARGPRLVFVHHVHKDMWRMTLPPRLAVLGDVLERRIAPPFYKRSTIATPSWSSKHDLVELGIPDERITVIPNGIEARFTPGEPGERSPVPLVAAVGRLVPVKRFHLLIRAAAAARASVPDLQLVIAGEGYERSALEAVVAELGADEWVSLPGRLRDHEIVDLYRRAWVLASSSLREGWGMSITEAAACGTPAVATDIGGHRDVVVHGETGLLAADDALAPSLVEVLTDHARRERMGAAALAASARFDWGTTATEMMRLLVEDSRRRHP
jgi:glycosyltransferase involved in cell wall biosynthesis